MTLYDLSIIFKLVSGETIICQVLVDGENNVTIKDPMQLHCATTVTENGVTSDTYYAPWFTCSKSRVHLIRKLHILSAAIPDETTQKEYERITTVKDTYLSKDLDSSNNSDPDIYRN